MKVFKDVCFADQCYKGRCSPIKWGSHNMGFPCCCLSSAFQPEFYCCLLQEKKEKLPHCRQKEKTEIPYKTLCMCRLWIPKGMSAGTQFMAYFTLAGTFLHLPVHPHCLIRLQPRSVSPWMTLNSFLLTVCSKQSLQWANLFCIRTVIRRDHFPSCILTTSCPCLMPVS